jgi:flagellar basal-body rod modification protein FlgD
MNLAVTKTVDASGQHAQASRASTAPAVEFENFLRLLTAQLRHQDPLSPLDSTEFVAQLASFSTVEQLVKANEKLDAISGGSNALEIYADWIGRDVGVAGPPARFTGAPVEFKISPNRKADRLEVAVTNAGGVEIARFLAANADGSQYWDGSTPGGVAAPGHYGFTAYYFADGSPIAQSAVTVFDRVDEVSLSSHGAATLRLSSGATVAPEEVTHLRAAL